MNEELKYEKVCLYCSDKFMSYRRTAKFDTGKCRKAWHVENTPGYHEGIVNAQRRYHARHKLKRNCERNKRRLKR